MSDHFELDDWTLDPDGMNRTVTVRVEFHIQDMARVQRLAETYCAGSVQAWCRYAALHMLPLPEHLVEQESKDWDVDPLKAGRPMLRASEKVLRERARLRARAKGLSRQPRLCFEPPTNKDEAQT